MHIFALNQELRKQCQDFATALLDHTRSSHELEVLLNHDPTGPAFEHGERMHLNRLKLAIKLRQKKVGQNFQSNRNSFKKYVLRNIMMILYCSQHPFTVKLVKCRTSLFAKTLIRILRTGTLSFLHISRLNNLFFLSSKIRVQSVFA